MPHVTSAARSFDIWRERSFRDTFCSDIFLLSWDFYAGSVFQDYPPANIRTNFRRISVLSKDSPRREMLSPSFSN